MFLTTALRPRSKEPNKMNYFLIGKDVLFLGLPVHKLSALASLYFLVATPSYNLDQPTLETLLSLSRNVLINFPINECVVSFLWLPFGLKRMWFE